MNRWLLMLAIVFCTWCGSGCVSGALSRSNDQFSAEIRELQTASPESQATYLGLSRDREPASGHHVYSVPQALRGGKKRDVLLWLPCDPKIGRPAMYEAGPPAPLPGATGQATVVLHVVDDWSNTATAVTPVALERFPASAPEGIPRLIEINAPSGEADAFAATWFNPVANRTVTATGGMRFYWRERDQAVLGSRRALYVLTGPVDAAIVVGVIALIVVLAAAG